MTRERKLAIQMWQEIVDKCKAGDNFSVVMLKMEFCKKHNLHWLNDCYFCQYCDSCSSCPLGSCELIYPKVCLEHDVASAEIILNALCGGTK